jgi:hypothetical protein
LRIDRGKGSEEENLEILEKLKNQKDQIENTFGEDLNWADLEGYRVCSIRKDYTKGGYRNNPKEWTEIIEEAVSNMKKLIEILSPIIRTLRLR